MKQSLGTLALLALAACGADRSGEHYAFVTMLGRDTLAVENDVRRGDTVTMDGVDRFPRVRIRHTVAVLNPDRSFHSLAMDIRTPSAALASDRERRVSVDFGKDSLVVTVKDSSGAHSRSFANDSALVLPHVQQMYSLAELYIDAAVARYKARNMKDGDSVTVLQFYPDAPLDNFMFHDGWVQPLKANRVEIWHGMISGVGFAQMDSSGRLMKYDGSQSTYKVDVFRVPTVAGVDRISEAFAATEQARGAAQLSVRDISRANIGAAELGVDYGRPLARGRKLVGGVIDLDEVWRTGANAATQFTTSAPITLAGLSVPAGKYTLWTLPHAKGVELIVSKQTGQWGTDYDASHDLGRAPMDVKIAPDTVEKFAITFRPTDANHGGLEFAWGTFRWTAPIVVR